MGRHEFAGNGNATPPRQPDAGDAAPLWERSDIEQNLVRDTEAYLDERARGLVPSSRLTEAWERFFRIGNSVIRGSILARRLSTGERDDCEQEFWAAVVAQLRQSRYDPVRAGLKTWLSALARNKSADVIRRRARRRQLALDEQALTAIPSRDLDPASDYDRKEEQAIMHQALATLSGMVSDCSFRVLVLRSVEGHDVPEVAAALGLTLEQVRYRHCRAKQIFRRLVKTFETEGSTGSHRLLTV
jgi:RNA polymerase sigma factor (sigma-70 family)